MSRGPGARAAALAAGGPPGRRRGIDLESAGNIGARRSQADPSAAKASPGAATPPAAPAPAAPDEAGLVARVLAGEDRLYGELVRLHQRQLYWSCLRLLQDPDEAEDVVQEAFVRAYRRLGDYDPAYRFYTWIFRIARNLCLNRLRRRKLWGFLSFSREGEASEVEAPDDTAAGAEARELAEALTACLKALPLEQRECFHLRHSEEFSYAEIARTLGVPVGTVMSRLSRAREKMRRCLESRGVAFG